MGHFSVKISGLPGSDLNGNQQTELGGPWKPDSLTQAFVRAAKKLNIKKRLNDLRGTAITNFFIAGYKEEAIAHMVGWEVKNVQNIQKHYVDPNRVVLGAISTLEREQRTG